MASELSHILRVLESMDKNLKAINTTLKAQNRVIVQSKEVTGEEAEKLAALMRSSYPNYIPITEDNEEVGAIK